MDQQVPGPITEITGVITPVLCKADDQELLAYISCLQIYDVWTESARLSTAERVSRQSKPMSLAKCTSRTTTNCALGFVVLWLLSVLRSGALYAATARHVLPCRPPCNSISSGLGWQSTPLPQERTRTRRSGVDSMF